ncbi:HP0268 family nuclease [Helicobacter trogontum]|uniref:HP0268 family nuclease n=1 Tax=Helicobacter trogontum TaxID=50960 RepID=A0ABQ0D408_9HELI
MELKLAKESLKANIKADTITFEDMAKKVEGNGKKGVVFYLDRENAEKDLKKLESFFKGKNRHTLIRELRYSMDAKDYIYEVHIL